MSSDHGPNGKRSAPVVGYALLAAVLAYGGGVSPAGAQLMFCEPTLPHHACEQRPGTLDPAIGQELGRSVERQLELLRQQERAHELEAAKANPFHLRAGERMDPLLPPIAGAGDILDRLNPDAAIAPIQPPPSTDFR